MDEQTCDTKNRLQTRSRLQSNNDVSKFQFDEPQSKNLKLGTMQKNCSRFLTDQYKKVKEYYQQSVAAEDKCNFTVSSPLGPVEQSNETRTRTQDLLDANKDNFLRAVAAQNKSLSDLQQRAHDLDKKVHHLSHKVCSMCV